MPDELKKNLIALFVKRGHKGKEIVEEVKDVLSLIAPELEKARFWDEHVKSLPEIANNIKQLRADAEKWRRVKEIAARDELEGYPCYSCPVTDRCDSSMAICGMANEVVNALEGEERG